MAEFNSTEFYTESQTNITYLEDIDAVKRRSLTCLSLLLLQLSLFGLFGNSAIIFSIYYVRSLRKPCNYLIGSLAVADILVSVLIMPLAVYQEIDYGAWHLGEIFCKLFLCTDVICTSATIWNLSLIAMDRYLAITKPFWYSPHRTVRNAFYAIIFAWATPVLLSVPAGFILKGETSGTTFICIPKKDAFFFVFSAVVAFYIPCSMITTVYFLIWRATRRLENRRKERKGSPGTVPVSITSVPNSLQMVIHSDTNVDSENWSARSNVSQQTTTSGKNRIVSFEREKRAAAVMSVILVVFICCWLPFFIFITFHGIKIHRPLNRVSFQVVHWFGWFNSTLNPVLYASLKRDFQRAFRHILRKVSYKKTNNRRQ